MSINGFGWNSILVYWSQTDNRYSIVRLTGAQVKIWISKVIIYVFFYLIDRPSPHKVLSQNTPIDLYSVDGI